MSALRDLGITIPVDEMVRVLRVATSEDHPYLEDTEADAKGAAYIAVANATADLIEASIMLNDGPAFAVGVMESLAGLMEVMVPNPGEVR